MSESEVTDREIEELCQEAGMAGDTEMVELCLSALGLDEGYDSAAARRCCADAIIDYRSQREDERLKDRPTPA